MKERFRRLIILVIQGIIIVAAFNAAILFRHDGGMPATYISSMVAFVGPLLFIKLICFNLLRLFSGWWRYVSIHDLVLLVKANLLGSSAFALYLHFMPPPNYQLSNTVIILDGILCFLLMSGARVAVRLVREYFALAHKEAYGVGSEKVLIVGAGAVGQSIARDIQQNPNLKWKVAGFIDQDVKRIRQRLQGVPVLATVDNLGNLLSPLKIDHVLIADPPLDRKELRKIVETCQKNSVSSKILPNVESMINGGVSINYVRDVKLEDLLGRPPVNLDVENIKKYLRGKKILVTGAAGSIGSEICRQVSQYGADTIILLDCAETPLFNIERELRASFPSVNFVPQLSNIRDNSQVEYVFNTFHPEVVFHAAAYKHVPMSEVNPLAVIDNNILGTRVLAYEANRHEVEHFVMVSTDKAVNPTNIMGASKRAAEVYVQALAQTSKTKMVTVRFGNVLGSNGSVVPIFKEQINNGGPVTVTHPEVSRYFMTIPESVQLVLQAGSMGDGGEIFVLEMGEQVKIKDLAEELIRLSGMAPYIDIDIEFTGLRPGEKLHEELLHDKENVLLTTHESIRVAKARTDSFGTLEKTLNELSLACWSFDVNQTMEILNRLVPEFQSDSGKHRSDILLLKPKKSKIISFPVAATGDV